MVVEWYVGESVGSGEWRCGECGESSAGVGVAILRDASERADGNSLKKCHKEYTELMANRGR